MTQAEQPSGGKGATRPRNWLRFLPFALFAAVGLVFGLQLASPPSPTLKSQLLGKPAPELGLPVLGEEGATLTRADFATDGATVVNYWASWCGPCRIEHPALMALSEREGVTMIGVAYHDKPDAARKFLDDLGDPFDRIGLDEPGQAALRWGIEGVPETFVINRAGEVVYKHSGPIQNGDLERKILPAIEQAQSGN